MGSSESSAVRTEQAVSRLSGIEPYPAREEFPRRGGINRTNENTMKALLFVAIAAIFVSPAFADDKPTDAEIAKIRDAIAQWGCEGGTYEKESEGSGVLEAEDVKCKSGQYDFRLDKDFSVFAITRD
ncbi:hypothetical protein [Hyphomicrobium sp. LHD-15]|uniref:hypothetical protein n=1 Tax=Hyphomicrobium sp. LHD-15 TaxID=3072142 RepID=UPI00280F12D4|nr:hypothetical protein [Hyphomicrobium sp. LHD-15]MDQ8699203.1 hypothetical protein [Hyphomicrobium sp. LHD-15]